VLVAACGGAPARPEPPKPSPPSAELSPALAPLAWWLGDWKGDDVTEHWVAAAGAIYGVAFHDSGAFEVTIIDDADGGGPADGVLRMFAMPGGTQSAAFTHVSHATGRVVFGTAEPADAKTIEYARTPKGLSAKLKTASGPPTTFDFTAAAHVAAPSSRPLTSRSPPMPRRAARRLGVVVRARWLDVAQDRQDRRRGDRREHGAAVGLGRARMGADLERKGGRARLHGRQGNVHRDTPGDHWKSSYVTLWKQQPDGKWKVLFDTGRGVNEP